MGMQDRDWYREQMKRKRLEQGTQHGYIHPALRRLHNPRSSSRVPAYCFWIGAALGFYLTLKKLGY
jgi:hypothetical protein